MNSYNGLDSSNYESFTREAKCALPAAPSLCSHPEVTEAPHTSRCRRKWSGGTRVDSQATWNKKQHISVRFMRRFVKLRRYIRVDISRRTPELHRPALSLPRFLLRFCHLKPYSLFPSLSLSSAPPPYRFLYTLSIYL